jgi:hypothetical protein
MGVAIAIVDSRSARTAAANGRALHECLSAYDRFVRTPMREPCSLLVARSQTDALDQQKLADLSHSRALMPRATWLDALRLQFWGETVEPLPLELAGVVANAAARHVLFADANNPLFEAVFAKLAHPFQRRRPSARRR